VLAIFLLVVLGTMAHSRAHASAEPAKPAAPVASTLLTPPAVEHYPDREAFFGETHQHTSWSFDAYIFGNHITGPADSYKYYLGETIKHPLGYDIKIETPLDFAGVTDHSEYAGVVRLANDPSSPLSKMPFAKDLVVHDAADIQRIYLWLGTSIMGVKPPIKQLMDPEVAGTVWRENNKVADEYNKPGKFTAFCAYEWTSNPDTGTCIATSFSRTAGMCPPCHTVRWIQAIRKTCGNGWTRSAKRAMNSSPSHITRI
jgi:hypothetical protein